MRKWKVTLFEGSTGTKACLKGGILYFYTWYLGLQKSVHILANFVPCDTGRFRQFNRKKLFLSEHLNQSIFNLIRLDDDDDMIVPPSDGPMIIWINWQ